jgi:hypothetical protein
MSVVALASNDEYHYDLIYTTDDARSDVEPSVAVQLIRRERDPENGLVRLIFNVVFAPFRVMK